MENYVFRFSTLFYTSKENRGTESEAAAFIFHSPFSIFNYLMAFTMSSRIRMASARAASL